MNATNSLAIKAKALFDVMLDDNAVYGKKDLVEVYGREPELSPIRGYSYLFITREGFVYNSTKNRLLRPYRRKGYIYYGLPGRTVGRYRLVAESFIPVPDELKGSKLVVNHINAVRDDDRIENLEWTTYRGNHLHAGLMGNTDKCSPLYVFDLKTGLEEFYPSATDAATALGLTMGAVLWRLKSDGQRVFPEMKLYRKYHSDTPWMVIPEKVFVEYGRERQVDVKYLETGEIKTFPSAREAAKALCVCDASMSKWLRDKNQPVLPGLVQIKFTSDTKPWRLVNDPYSELAINGHGVAIIVRWLKDDRTAIFPSVSSVAKELSVKTTTLHYRLENNPGKVYDGIVFGFYPESAGSVLAATLE